MTINEQRPYEELTPEVVLDAVEASGAQPDGRLLALNSYENRVYQVGVEEGQPLVAKFYRPGRWSDEAILEEHTFALELVEHEIPVVPPIPDDEGQTLRRYQGFRFALFQRKGGHWPELDDPETLVRIGRFLGRIHSVGEVMPFRYRPSLDVQSFVEEPAHFLLEGGFIPDHYRPEYESLIARLIESVNAGYRRAGKVTSIRLHGDCHPGNILWTDAGPHFVDLDDCRMGPAIQDLWMLLSGDRGQMTRQLAELLDGYEEFHSFEPRQLHLIEPLRTLRMVHYAAWLARRWDDPAFPFNFPWFNTPRYWEEHILSLREQLDRLEEPPLALFGM